MIISGAANTKIFTYTTNDTIPTSNNLHICIAVYTTDEKTSYRYVDSIDTTNSTITLSGTLSSTLPIESETLVLKYGHKMAIGDNSHAEGSGTVAYGGYSHSEGINTLSYGLSSHAEGSYTAATASNGAHAEGRLTVAKGSYSHASGLGTIASASGAYTEGIYTVASAAPSHAEGSHTIAQRRSNHVFGEYNLPDTGGTGTSVLVKGDYIEIVGNGTAEDVRSNARTLDWSGNEVLAGKLTVGAGPVNDMDVATKQYVDTAVSGGNSDVMIVTVTDTYNEETGERTYSADKTFAEISAHINSGGIAVCDINHSIYQLRVFVSDQITFSHISLDNNDYGTYMKANVVMGYVVINDDNSINVFETSYVPMQISTDLSDGQILIFDGEEYVFKNSPIPSQNATISMSNNVITLTNASGQTSSITLPVYNGAVSGGAS